MPETDITQESDSSAGELLKRQPLPRIVVYLDEGAIDEYATYGYLTD